jgi:hypothetical protein
MPDIPQTPTYSTKKISETLVVEIKQALKSVKAYGSVEIFIQDGSVTQITVRNIRKTGGSQARLRN